MFSWINGLLRGLFDFLDFVVYAIFHPLQFLGFLVCSAADSLFSILPSTPDNLKISSLISSIGSSLPLIGSGIIHELFTTVASIVGILVVIKIYKLLPFKMS